MILTDMVKGLEKHLSQVIHIFKVDTDAAAAHLVKQSQMLYEPKNLPPKM